MMKTSVIGLGAMGAGIAGNLQRAGLLLAGWNRTKEAGQAAAKQHDFTLAPTLEMAAVQAEVVITCVSADSDLLEVAARLGACMQAGSVVVDTSTVSAQTAQQVSDRLEALGVHFLDAPVSGGKEGAENGSMVMMVGGEEFVMQKITEVLDVISSKATYMGPIGSGQRTKAVNQIMVAGINQAVTEALAFAHSEGLDVAKVIDTLGGGAAGNWFLQHRGQTMSESSYEPGFKVALHDKDLAICQSMLQEKNVQLPIVEMTRSHYQQLLEQGYGDEDISALYRIKSDLFK